MADGMTFKDEMQSEKTKWKEMTGRQRLQYFKDYYMLKAIVVVIILAVVVSLIRTITRNSREVLLSGYFINVTADEEFYTKLEDGYFSYREGNPKKQQVDLGTDITISPAGNGMTQTDTANKAKVMALISGKLADYMIMDSSEFEEWNMEGVYADLSEVMTDEQLEELAPYLTEVTDEETGNTYPAAIRLDETELAEEYDLTALYGDGSIYLVIMQGAPNLEEMSDFVNYILNKN